ncbi:hypothetical protein A2U01_0101888, partial [Trifolium medium]|nr:hypothetical protein [Trifolium medium]
YVASPQAQAEAQSYSGKV